MAGTRYGLEDVAGYDPVQLLAYRDAMIASNGNPQSDRHFLWVEVGQRRLLRWLGVRYYVAQDGAGAAQADVVLRTPTATVVRDDKALPIARVNRPGRTRRRRASSCASPTASSSRRRPGRPAGSCSPIRSIRAGR